MACYYHLDETHQYTKSGEENETPVLSLCHRPLLTLPHPPISLFQHIFGFSCTLNLLGQGLKILT